MKILIASDLHYPVINGVATFTRNLAQGLAAKGHEVVVIAPSQDGKKSVEVDGNYTIYRTRSTVFPFYQNFRISVTPQLEVRKIIQDFSPDVIHIQMLLGIGQAAMTFGRRYNIPVVSTSHAMADNLLDNLRRIALVSKPIAYMLNDYGRRFHSKADAITSPTLSALKVFGKHAEKISKPIEIISNGVDLAAYAPGLADDELLKKYGLPTDKPIISYVGRIDAEKHLWVLLKAFHRLIGSHDAHLLVIGDGVDLDNLKDLAKELDINDRVTFTGRVSDEDKIGLHRAGTVFCMPSPFELQSIATLEAMACGQPVVAVDAGALTELCHDNENGYLYDLDDDEMMSRAIGKILGDRALRDKFSAESLRIAGEHDIDHTLEEFIALYKRVIDDKKKQLADSGPSIIERTLG